MRIVKRAQRVNRADSSIVSRDPTLTPEEDARQFYEEIYQTLDPPDEDPEWDTPEDDTWKDLLTDYKSVKRFFSRYNKTKSCGMDGFHAKLIVALGGEDNKIYELLALFFNLFTTAGTTPQDWNVSLTTPIPKGKEGNTIDLQRPISLTSMFRRCYEAEMHWIFQARPHRFRMAHANFAQAGFQAAQSTLLQALVSEEFQRLHGGAQIFIDLKQAYDRVDLSRLLRKMTVRGVPTSVLEILHSLFIGCSSKLAINGHLTQQFE
jgi:hypothetical protein